MYHKINIAKLSHAQIVKLLQGHRIRVKHGHGHEIEASEEQAKKIMSAHRRGAGCTMQFDPYQIDRHQHLKHGGTHGGHGGHPHAHAHAHAHSHAHGEGFFGDIAKGAFKTLAPIAIDAGAKFVKNKIAGGALNPAGYGYHHAHHVLHEHEYEGEGIKKIRGRKGHGVHQHEYHEHHEHKAHTAPKKKGSGVRGRAKGHKGKGIGQDILRGAASIAPLAFSFL